MVFKAFCTSYIIIANSKSRLKTPGQEKKHSSESINELKADARIQQTEYKHMQVYIDKK